MVNTFMPFPSILQSVRSLDKRRLNRQKMEAIVIYYIIYDAKYLAKRYKLGEMPTGRMSGKLFLERKEWLKKIYKTYFRSDEKIYFNKITKKYIIRKERYRTLPIDIRGVGMRSYAYHPMVQMWLGYENALRYYVNCCIDECIARGINNTVEKLEVFTPINIPFWIRCPTLNLSHISALYRKEVARKEPKHYTVDPRFLAIKKSPFVEKGYLWLPQLSEKQIDTLIKNRNLKCVNFCAEILKDWI